MDWSVLLAPPGESEWAAIRLSLKVAALAAAASLLPGVAVAYLLARRRFPGRVLVDGLVHLPLILPPVVTGYILLLLFGRRGPIGLILEHWLGFSFSFRWTGAALAGAVMGFPLLVRTVRLSIEAVDRGGEQAAATLGAGRLRVWATITLPLILPGILAGTVLSFARSLGEFGATVTFVGNIPNVTQTLPGAIYSFLQVPGGDAMAMRLSALSVLLSLCALALSEMLARSIGRRLGQR